MKTDVLNHNNFSVFIKYSEQFANLLFTDCRGGNFVTIYGDKNSMSFRIDQEDIFRNTIIDFVDRIRKQIHTESIDELIEHIYVLRMIDKSLREK